MVLTRKILRLTGRELYSRLSSPHMADNKLLGWSFSVTACWADFRQHCWLLVRKQCARALFCNKRFNQFTAFIWNSQEYSRRPAYSSYLANDFIINWYHSESIFFKGFCCCLMDCQYNLDFIYLNSFKPGSWLYNKWNIFLFNKINDS